MAFTGIISLILWYLVNICLADDSSVLEIVPPAYLPGVTTDVQLTCRPPVHGDVSQVLTLELLKDKDNHMVGLSPVASYITSGSPRVEALGALMNASVTASYDVDHPDAAFLSLNLPHPTDTADGRYTCSVETLDRYGQIHRDLSYTTLVSLAKSGTVPVFYQNVLKELRKDVDALTTDLDTASHTQLALSNADNQTAAKIQAISSEETRISNAIDDVRAIMSDTVQTEDYLRQELQRLRNITPESPVSFYAYLSSSYVAPNPGTVVVFNVLEEHSDDGYSTATGVFTAPEAGTYYFTAGVTAAYSTQQVYVSIVVNDIKMTSLYAYDDYTYKHSTAALVVSLEQGDEVKVVQASQSATRIYGSISSIPNHISHFMGLLLW